MWTQLAFLFFVSATVAWDGPWKLNTQYEFDVHAKTFTGIPELRDQYTGVVSRGQLIFQVPSQGKVVGHFIGLQDGSFHGYMENSYNGTSIPYENVKYQDSKLNNKPFHLNFKNGVVKSLEVDNSMTNDEVNQLKGYLTQLQIDMEGENLIKLPENQLPSSTNSKPSGLYRTMEASITGHCETLYEVAPIADFMLADVYPYWEPDTSVENKENYFQIMKTMNYSNCVRTRGYHHGIWSGSTTLRVNSNQIGEFLSKSAISRIVASGNAKDFDVHYTASITKVAASPELHQKQQISVVSIVELTLVRSEKLSSPLPEPASPLNVGSLVYRYNIPSDLQNKVRDGSDDYVDYDDHIDSAEVLNVPWRDLQDGNIVGSVEQKRFKRGNWIQQSRSSSGLPVQRHSDKYWQPTPTMDEAPEHPFVPYFVGYQGHEIPYEVKMETEISKLVKEMSDDLQDRNHIAKNNVLEKYKICVDLIRTASLKQLQTVDQEWNAKRSDGKSDDWIIYRDGVAAAGTGPAISLIEVWLTTGRLHGTAAVKVLGDQPKVIHTPTEEHIIAFMRILKSQPVQNDHQVHTAASFALADLVYAAFSNYRLARNYYPVDSYGPFHHNLSQIVGTQVFPYFEDALKTAVQQKNDRDVLVYIRALGNLGHQGYLRTFKKYYESQTDLSTFQRTAAVLALYRLAQNDPELTLNVLYKIYQNVGEAPEVRATAVLMLIRCDPPTAMLQKIAAYTYEDPSEQVQSIVQSSIEAIAKLEAPKDQLRATKAESARQFLNPRRYPNGFSRFNLAEYFLDGLNFVRQQTFAYYAGRDSPVPNHIRYQSHHHSGGLITSPMEIDAMVSSVKDLMQYFVKPESSPIKDQSYPDDWNVSTSKGLGYPDEHLNSDETDGVSRKVFAQFADLFADHKIHYPAAPPKDSFNKNDYGKVFRGKPIHDDIERDEEERLEGQIYHEILGSHGFLAFDYKTIQQLSKEIKEKSDRFANGQTIAYNKIHNDRSVFVGFPLATGSMFFYSLDSPVLVQIDGNVKVEMNPVPSAESSVIKLPETANFTASVHVVYSRSDITRSGFNTPYNGQSYVAGHVRKSFFHAPLVVKIDADLKNQHIEVQLSPQNPNEDFTLAHFSSWPYTLQRDVFSLRPDAEHEGKKLIHTRDPKEIDRWLGEKSTGLVLHFTGKYEAPAENNGPISLFLKNYKKDLNIKNLPSVFLPNIFLPPEGVDLYHGNVHYDGKRTKASTIKFGFSFKSQNVHNKNTGKWQKGLPDSYPGIKSGQPLTRESEWMFGTASGMNNGRSTVFKMWVNFEGTEKNTAYSTYEVAGAYARSHPSDLSRLYFVSRISEQNNKHEQQYCLAAAVKQVASNYLATSNLERALKVSHLVGAEFKIAVGSDCNKKDGNAEIQGLVTIDQTEQFKNYIRETPEARHCKEEMKEDNYLMPACHEAIRKARIPNSIMFDIHKKGSLKHVEVLQRLVTHVPDLKPYYRGLEENQRISGILEMSGGMDYYNGTIKYKDHEYEVDELEIHPWLRDILINGEVTSVPIMRIVPHEKTCVLDKNKILTYNQRVIDHPIGNCGYMMTIREVPNYQFSPDVKERRRYVSVLAADPSSVAYMRRVFIFIEDESGKLHMIQALGHGKGYRPTVISWTDDNSDPTQITSDQHYQVIDNGVVRVHVYPASQSDDNLVVVAVHDGSMHIHFDGQRIKVVADQSYRNELRGLCGTNDLEKYTDTVSPRNCHHRDPKYFVNAWSMTTKEAYCSTEVEKEKEESLKAVCHPIEYIRNTVISPYELGIGPYNPPSHHQQQGQLDSGFGVDDSKQWKSNHQSNTTPFLCEMKEETYYEEKNNEICFSLKPLPKCPPNCVSKHTQRTVDSHCMKKNDPMAILYTQQIRKKKNPHFGEHAASKKVVFNVPKVCHGH